jgi:hypothetical protein
VARVDQSRQSHVQIIDGGIVHGVNIHAGRFSVADQPEVVKTQSVVVGGLSCPLISDDSILSTVCVFEIRRVQDPKPQPIGVEVYYSKSALKRQPVSGRVYVMLHGSGATIPALGYFRTVTTARRRFTPRSSA